MENKEENESKNKVELIWTKKNKLLKGVSEPVIPTIRQEKATTPSTSDELLEEKKKEKKLSTSRKNGIRNEKSELTLCLSSLGFEVVLFGGVDGIRGC